jgi:putative ABC transport system permease protein
MTNIYLLAVAALILLIISMSNYASLNLCMAGFNSKFIAISRVLGSAKLINLKYFIIESLFTVTLSIAVAIFITLPTNIYIKNNFNIDLFQGNGLLITFVIFIFALLSVLSGLQPVFKQQISRFRLNENLLKSNKIKTNKAILITQYSFAIMLLISVIVITRQTNFVLDNSMGNKEDNIICFESVHADVQQKFGLFKSELLKNNSIESVSAMFEPPGGETNDMFEFELDGIQPKENENLSIGVFPCDYSFVNLFHLTFLGGENFSKKNKEVDGSGEYIINETAMNFMNFTNADQIVGKQFKLLSPVPEVELPEGKIIGVVKDFHLSSLKKKVEPLVLFKRDTTWLLNFAIAYKPEMKKTALAEIQKVWTNMFPAYPMSYEQVGVMYRKIYKTELLQSNLLSIFTFISLFITSIGLLGMSLLISQQRIKEIGIRKVNGAKVSEIMTLLNKNFIKWVLIAFIIACPIAYVAMNKWLESFAYKTTLSWWIFALAGIAALIIALLTVSWQSFKVAVANPIEALKDE